MTKTLTVHNAEIATATVEVKTLTISGKQVTLAVFRQLQEARLVGEDGLFRGLPWGTVNYHPDKSCRYASEHLHVVWQFGEELRRCRMAEPWFNPYWSETCDRLFAACCSRRDEYPYWSPPDWARRETSNSFAFFVRDLDCVAQAPSGVRHGVNQTALNTFMDEVMPQRDALHQTLMAEAGIENSRRVSHRQRWREINDLPQLFIAV